MELLELLRKISLNHTETMDLTILHVHHTQWVTDYAPTQGALSDDAV